MPKDTFINYKAKPVGEPFVWFTAMGLSIGLLMIVLLLGVILVKGVEIFWPDRAVVAEMALGSDARIGESHFVAGVVKLKQEKNIRSTATEFKEGYVGPKSNEEWQFFLGNKDVYGFSFKFINYDQIKKISHPKDLMRIERLEYGDAFGFPISIELATGEQIFANDPAFNTSLEKLKSEAVHKWEQISHIEKKEIGRVNHKLDRLKLKKKVILKNGESLQADKVQKIDAKIDELEAAYSKLAAEARVLRNQQTQQFFTYKLATGQEKRLATGQIVDFYYPNQLSFLDRVSRFFHRAWLFVTEEPREANTEGGVFPAIFGTFVMTVLMSIAVTPLGVIAAIYLREYAKQGPFVRCVRIAVNNLAGVPSIVFGVFGLGFFVYFVGGTIDSLFFKDALPTPTFGTGGVIWASLTLALMTVPVVIVATEEALAAVPRGMREGSLACGASKWQTIQRIVLPGAAPGILTGLILAMARGAGEVAPLMLVGVVKLAPSLAIDGLFPFIHLERKFMHLGFHIYDLGFQSPDSEAAKPMVFATTLLLITLVVMLNLGAIIIRNRLRKKYATGAF